MRAILLSTTALLLAACGNDVASDADRNSDSDEMNMAAADSPANSTDTGDMAAADMTATGIADNPGVADTMNGEPVPQGEPNVPSQTPAFPGQTRAPQSDSGVTLQAEEIAGFDEPWGMALLPDGAALVTERGGDLYMVSAAGEKSSPITGVPEVDNRDQGGLLDIAISPDFSSDRMVYIAFSEPRGDNENGTSLARGTLSEDMTALENVEVIFQQMPSWESTKHFGNNIEFDGDGHLFLTLGERSLPEPRQLAQDLDAHLGKVVRLNMDGTAPDGNPFTDRDGALPEIWSYGHRNIQGADIHPETGRLWTIEHGPAGGDEINIPSAGTNYGWPVVTYGEDYDGTPIGDGITEREGMAQPVYYWDPVIAPGDMVFYEGAMFADWQGDLLVASLKPGAIVRLELDGERIVGEERLLTDLARIRDIDVDKDGSLLILTDETNGGLYRVTPE
ncbi:PQQ-dependent sugar dehydrogenase [Aquisalinus flavus]|uniref:Glucose dehydrogenase n=1 Tax=Aquisalinus flavus TaxID=1526572 RepID=A0A8J2V504_9PROT|nr:PQQ-dependent sugar dehydrogenase [Aquisalinus flavus]GGD14991.1 glucose dehydrogenase [Aquisalinus flavus]